ncbi:MAG TPA: AAA family ATPase, partial [Polyangiaceae bacterium]|nr:AAA family ATPase [Polyangiaceae bacterium]
MTEYGRYQLFECIGQGGLTEVFRAKRYGVEGFEKTLVVKRLLDHWARDEDFVRRFIRQGQLALRLSHSNVVHVLDLGEVELPSGKSYFLATELVSGVPLADLLELARLRGRPFVLEMALHIAAEVCRALDHAHRRRDALGGALSIRHGKLTSANIFVSDEGEVKVADFCTAALAMANGSAAAAAALPDLAALGALLYEMLRLAPPPVASAPAFTGLGLPIDELLGRLLLGDPALDAAEAHEQILMHAYACRDWVGAEQVRGLVSEWRAESPTRPTESFPPPLASIQSSFPPAVALDDKGAAPALGDFRPFVGRAVETKQIGMRLAQVTRRQLQAVGIVGAPGIGKSRFILELRRRLQRGGLNLAFHVVRCPVGGRQQAYSAVVTMLRALFGVVGTFSVDRASLVVLLRTLGLSGPKADAVLCELGASPETDSAAPPLGAAVEQIFSRLADDRMHVFAWDDADELDDASARLLSAASEVLVGKRIALLFAARSAPSQFLRDIEAFQEMRLEGLDATALARLVQVRLGVSDVPPELEDLVRNRSSGNPMFVEEILREGVTSGAIVTSGQSLVALDLERIAAVPETIETLLANRVRRLTDLELEALRLVARLDEWADVERIARSVRLPHDEVMALLLSLADRNLVVVEDERARLPTRLIEQALLADATPDLRAALEARAADALLEGGSDDARLLEQAALRMEAAGEPERASENYERAARARAENARPERTIPLMLKALELIPLETRSAASVLGAIELLASSSVGGESAKLVEMVRRLAAHLLARSDVARDALVDGLLDLVRIQRATLYFHEALQLLLKTQSLARKAPGKLATVRLLLADTQIALGDFEPAIETLKRFDRMAVDPPEAQRHEALVVSAHAHAQKGDRVAALGLLESAATLEHAHDEGHALRRAQVRALVHALGNEWHDSGAAAATAANLARSLGRHQQETAYRHYEGEALTYLGDYPRAYAAFRSSLAL